MKSRVLLAIMAAALLVPSVSQAAAPDGPGPWADFVQDVQQGQRKDGSPVLPQRSDPNQALGPAERTSAEGTFFSLGFGGRVTLGFENPICNGNGDDLAIELVESTNEPHMPELVDVFASEDGVNFVLVAEDVNKDSFLSLPPELEVAHFVRLIDDSDPDHPDSESHDDGYDVDGVQGLNDADDCEPPPPAGTFSCRASALRVQLLGLEPYVANAKDSPCEDQTRRLLNLTGLALPVQAKAVFAETDADPGGQPGAHSEGGAVFVNIGSGSESIQVAVLSAQADAKCVNGEPTLSGDSQVVGLTIGGNPILVPPGPQDIPVGPLGTIHLNEKVEENGRITTRALRYEGPLQEIVVGEATANFEGDPCP